MTGQQLPQEIPRYKMRYVDLTQDEIDADRSYRRKLRENRTEEQKQRERENDGKRYQRDREKRLAAVNEYAKRNKEKILEKLRAKHAANPERNREKIRNRTPEQIARYQLNQRQRRNENIEEFRAKEKKRRDANAEKVKANKRVHYQKHREKILAHDHEYRLKNLEKRHEYDRQRQKTESRKKTTRECRLRTVETIRNGWRNRYARKKQAEGTHTKHDVAAIYMKQQGFCAGCEMAMDLVGKNRYHVDHYLALARGGTNWPDNLQLLCPKCNMSKGAALPEEWEQRIKPRRIREQLGLTA